MLEMKAGRFCDPTDSIYLTIVPKDGILYPWSLRSHREWKSLVKETEAINLFSSAPYDPSSLAKWVERFQLERAVEVFWGSVDRIPRRNNRNWTPRYQEQAEEAAELLSGRKVLPYFMALRQLSGNPNNPKIPFIEAAELLGLDDEETRGMRDRYNKLATVVTPIVTNLARRRISDNDEALSRAGLSITRTLGLYYWEPLVISPPHSFNGYISYLRPSLGWSGSDKFDTQGLEQRPENLQDMYRSPDDTEESALEQASRQQINRRLRDLLSELEKPARRVIALRYSAGLSVREISECSGLPNGKVRRILDNFLATARNDEGLLNEVSGETSAPASVNPTPERNKPNDTNHNNTDEMVTFSYPTPVGREVLRKLTRAQLQHYSDIIGGVKEAIYLKASGEDTSGRAEAVVDEAHLYLRGLGFDLPQTKWVTVKYPRKSNQIPEESKTPDPAVEPTDSKIKRRRKKVKAVNTGIFGIVEQNPDYFRDLLKSRGDVLSDSHRGVALLYLLNFNGNKQEALEAVNRAFPYRPLNSVRRHVEEALNILYGRKDYQGKGRIASLLRRKSDQIMFKNLAQNDPSIWASFDPRDQEILLAHAEGVTNREIARGYGFNEATISKIVDRCRRKIISLQRHESR